MTQDFPVAGRIKLWPYSIQWFLNTPGPCARCRREVGSGPVGFRNSEPAGPLCDKCLLDQHFDMGMLLLMANVTRELAKQATRRDALEAEPYRALLMTFSKVYDQGADWPLRRKEALGYLWDLMQQDDQVPLEAVLKMIDGDSH